MSSSLQKIYEEHHQNSREAGFSILKQDRGMFFKNLIGKNKRVLDIGCRDGALTSYFTEGNKVLGVDIDTKSLRRAEDVLGIETLCFDLQGDWSKLSGQSFDVVVAGEVLEHVYYPERIAGEVSRLLSAGGIFIGSVPNAFSLINRLRYLKGSKRFTPLSDPTHINQFSAEDLKKMLETSFADVSIKGLGRLGFLARNFPSFFAFDLCFIAKK